MTMVLRLAGLVDDHLGDPPTVRWLLIQPTGLVTVRTADNHIARANGTDTELQWRLIRDVHTEVDPGSRGLTAFLGGWSLMLPVRDGRNGIAVVCRHDNKRPPNPLATMLLAAYDVDHQVFGGLAWLGPRDSDGFHTDLGDELLRSLRNLAAHSRT